MKFSNGIEYPAYPWVCVIVDQNRVEHEAYFLVGKRSDTLRLEGGTWRLLRREVELDQNVLLDKNLTVFF